MKILNKELCRVYRDVNRDSERNKKERKNIFPTNHNKFINYGLKVSLQLVNRKLRTNYTSANVVDTNYYSHDVVQWVGFDMDDGMYIEYVNNPGGNQVKIYDPEIDDLKPLHTIKV